MFIKLIIFIISLKACNEILKTIEERNLTESDIVFVLISGGGSALLPSPISGRDFKQLQIFLMKAVKPTINYKAKYR